MSSIPRIVKSIAVVDDRSNKPDYIQARMETALINKRVLKGGALGLFEIDLRQPDSLLSKDQRIEEINRLGAQIDNSRAELRELHVEIMASRDELARIQEVLAEAAAQEHDLEDDTVYEQRRREIEGLLGQTQQQILEMQVQAEENARRIAQEARETGYNEGFKSGHLAAEISFQDEAYPKLKELADLISGLTDYAPELMKEKENEFVDLIIAIAGKVLQKEIKTDNKSIIQMLHDYLERNHREAYINLTISPDLMPESARASTAVLDKLKELAGNLSIYIEKEAPEGHMVLETPKGVTDMSLDTQLANIKETLLEE